ncbi:MAG: nucleotide sugar dehydrogenase [Methermicoccaceae archaeon]
MGGVKISIAVVGLGKAGLPIAAVVAEAGFEVVGIDVDREKVKKINAGENPLPEELGLDELIARHGGKTIRATTSYEDASDCEMFIVIVPLLLNDNFFPDMSMLEGAVRNVGRVMKRGALVVVETTLPPGTTAGVVRRWLEEESGFRLDDEDYYLANSPERIMTGRSISRLQEFPKVVGGVNKKSGDVAYSMYRRFVPKLHLVSSATLAELIKVAEGCYRDVNIALANELFRVASALDVDFYEMREYANHEFCNIHLPSTGVGGHCIPVYPWFLIHQMEQKGDSSDVRLLRTARDVNDEMVDFWAEKIIKECLNINKPLKDIKICISGITFREGVKEVYYSRNIALVKFLMKKGLDVFVYDELFTKEEVEEMGLKWMKTDEADIVFNSFELEIVKQGD